jgi:Flp pilus assembly protein TadD
LKRLEEILTKIDETLRVVIRKANPMPTSKRVMTLSKRFLTGLPILGSLIFASMVTDADAFPFARKKAAVEAPAATPNVSPVRSVSPQIEGPGPTTPAPNQTPPTQEAAAVPEVPATPSERLAARGQDLVSQSRFWMDELRKRPTDTEAAYEASVALRAIGSADRAVQTAAMGIQASANDPRLWAALALSLVGDNQNEAAIQALQKAIALNPRDARLQNSLGVVLDRLETPAQAAIAYQAALVLAPGDSAILSNYGLSVAMAGDLPRGEVLLRQAVQNPIAPPQARQNLALVVGLQGRFTESEQLASRDLPPAVATENVAYLRRMLNGGDSRWSQAASAGN